MISRQSLTTGILVKITTFEGPKSKAVTSQFELQEVINEPTHILEKSVSCIDFIFNSQTNFVMDQSIHSSLCPNYHHQMVLA